MKMKYAMKVIVFLTVLLLPFKSFGAENVNLIFVAAVSADDKGNGMRLPEGIACNDKSDVVVADSGNGRLLKYTFKNETLQGGSEIKPAQLSYPVIVQLNSKGEIFALDEKQRRVARLGADGAFEGFVETAGVPAPDTVVPRSFRVDSSDRIYICDIFGARVLIFDPAGKFVRQIPFPDNYGFISDLAVDPRGKIYLLDSVRAMIYTAAADATAFTPITKEMKEYMDFPVSITLDSRGVIYVVDKDGGNMSVIGQDGTFMGHQLQRGWKEGLLYYPSQFCIDDKGYFFIADRNNGRVQIFSMLK